MSRYLIRRFLFAIITLLLASMIVFGLSRLAGDPLLIYAKPGGYGMSPQRVADLSKKLGGLRRAGIYVVEGTLHPIVSQGVLERTSCLCMRRLAKGTYGRDGEN